MQLVALDVVKDACNIAASDTTKDDWIADAINAATEVIESIVGPVVTATRTFTGNGGSTSVLLPTWASSITSVTVGGVATTDYVADLTAGVVYCGDGISGECFAAGIGNVVVIYETGNAVVPYSVQQATTELVRHWFQNGQQGSRPSFGGAASEAAAIGSSYAVPRRVTELLEPHTAGRMPGIG